MARQRTISLLALLLLLSGIGLGWARQGAEARHAHTSSLFTGTCPPVQNTPKFTIVYGSVTLNEAPAPSGTVVEARSPRGDTVGCVVVSEAGDYGSMYVYGEDTSVSPPVPGMRTGEEVAFYVDGNLAVASPVLFWQNDFELHQVDLDADTEATPTPTSTMTPTSTPTATSTSTATPTLDPDDPTPTFTPTATPSPGAAPDLVVTDIQAGPTAPTVGQPVTITIVVKNQGNVDISTFFYADFYVDHAPTACEGGDGYVRINSLTSGNEVSVTATYAGFTTTGQHSIYAQADSSCQVSEDNETNNAYGPLRLDVQGEPPPTPSAAFDAVPVSGAVPLGVEFDDLSTGQITDWLWDFGDGYTSTLQHPDHVYAVTGTFDVSLYVEGPGGVDTETKAGFISVSELFYVYLPLVIRQ